MPLKNKSILLCVTGGVAAYKAAAVTSRLSQKGADVKVLMTANAKKFVMPLTFQALSRNPVYDDTFDEKDPKGIAHIDLADGADLVLAAPATANMIAKMANGIADDMITTTILATKAPVWVAPAMNVNMYEHPAVQENLQALAAYGYRFIEPGAGLLACGWVGKGRLAEPEDIIAAVEGHFESDSNKPLQGKKVLVTAGPTKERVDPVRYFTNHSSGKMGYAVAEVAQGLGADVTLVSGTDDLTPPNGVTTVTVTSAEEMYRAVMAHFSDSDVVIKTAAVADYRPKVTYNEKFKKKDGNWHIEMEHTKDILATLGERKDKQILVGFAAESDDIEERARQKLKNKNLDMIVANNITEEGSGFRSDTNTVLICKRDGTQQQLPNMMKRAIAAAILDEVATLLKGTPTP
jgi:phosphopantothenoylcysteine decarboxylase/phosphopantothenate--cysteine ligase